MSEETKEEISVEDQIITLSETLVETAKEFNKLETRHKELSVKFNSFAKAVLNNSDKDIHLEEFLPRPSKRNLMGLDRNS